MKGEGAICLAHKHNSSFPAQAGTHNRFYPTQKHFAEAILRFFRATIPKTSATGVPITSASSHTKTFEFCSEVSINKRKFDLAVIL